MAGKTRQAGLLSFTRVFQAGHEGVIPSNSPTLSTLLFSRWWDAGLTRDVLVPYYKPKESLALFTRALRNRDISKGDQDSADFVTEGPSDVRDVTADPEGNEGDSFCYVMNAPLDGFG